MRRILALTLALLLLLPCFSAAAAATGTINEEDAPMAEDISVTAYAAILIDMDSGMTLYEYNADDMNYPASTTKVMTAYLCLKYGDPEDEVTVSSSAFDDITERASTGGLVVGETMTVHRLLQALLVVSASEAANVVAEYISGSREEFVELMNEEAEALGCTGTHFANCHGLPNSDHYTTARDLSKIAQAAMEYEEFRDIVGAAVTTMEATNKHSATTITSTNGILPGSSYPAYNYPYAIGIKTGHTSVAGYCLVSAADKDGRRLLCVVMGCGSRTGSFAQTIKLYDWGYENYDALTYGQEVEGPALPDPEDDEDSVLEAIDAEIAAEDSALEASSEESNPVVVLEVPAASSTAEASPSPSEETTQSLSELLSGSMLPVVICFAVVALLIISLLIVLVVMLVRRRK